MGPRIINIERSLFRPDLTEVFNIIGKIKTQGYRDLTMIIVYLYF